MGLRLKPQTSRIAANLLLRRSREVRMWPKAAVIGIRPGWQLSGDKPLSTPVEERGRI